MVAGLYFLILHKDFNYRLMIGVFFTGILAGTRLSYLPALIVPVALAIYKSKDRKNLLYSFVFGIIIWLLPLIWVTGWDDLIIAASKQTIGHFTEFGGTSFTENDWSLRLKLLFSSIWADGFGGYLVGRHWLTLILSTVFIFISMLSANTIIKDFRSNNVSKLLFYSLIVYTIWILFFQNVIYKSRHVIPIVIVLLYFLAVDKGTSFYKNLSLIHI